MCLLFCFEAERGPVLSLECPEELTRLNLAQGDYRHVLPKVDAWAMARGPDTSSEIVGWEAGACICLQVRPDP